MSHEILEELPAGMIRFSKNYRQTFPDSSLKDLAKSIAQHGIIQPITVRRRGEFFELIAGDRRLRASRIAGLETIPARVLQVTDAEVLELQLVENVQREAVPFYEEALALKRLKSAPYNYTQDQIADKIGKSQAYVGFQLQLTRMSHTAQQVCAKGQISKSVAWLISRLPSEDMQSNAARALAREKKSKLVGERAARHYIEDLKTGMIRGDREKALGGMKSDGAARKKRSQPVRLSSYVQNWRQHLLEMSPAQLVEWQKEVAGRIDPVYWARAVESVLSKKETGAAA